MLDSQCSAIDFLNLPKVKPWSFFLIKVEKSESCQEVIRARQKEGHFSAKAPVFSDVETFQMDSLPAGKPPVGMTGGFPCQARHCVIHFVCLQLFCS